MCGRRKCEITRLFLLCVQIKKIPSPRKKARKNKFSATRRCFRPRSKISDFITASWRKIDPFSNVTNNRVERETKKSRHKKNKEDGPMILGDGTTPEQLDDMIEKLEDLAAENQKRDTSKEIELNV